jgi:hypothetical protein
MDGNMNLRKLLAVLFFKYNLEIKIMLYFFLKIIVNYYLNYKQISKILEIKIFFIKKNNSK